MMCEVEDFNKYWDEKMNDFEEKSKQIENLINERHKQEFKDLEDEMHTYVPKIKPNHDYNILKMTEIRLKKIDKFMEAEDLKAKCERLEKKQLNEINVAKRKLQDEYNIMLNMKEKEYNKLMTRFRTRKIELDLQQKHEKNANRDLNVIKQSKYHSIITKINLITESANERFSVINMSLHSSKIDFNARLGQSFRNNSMLG